MSVSKYPSMLRWTLLFIAAVQFALAAGFLFAPEASVRMLGLSATPEWANWLFGQMAARCAGFGLGMVYAARHLDRARPWVKTMIVVQTIDWLVTVKYLMLGAMRLDQVATAPFFPLLFVLLLSIAMPRRSGDAAR